MARLSVFLAFLGLLSSGLVTAFDQEKENADATCDNNCFFGSFPGNSCANDEACMCTLKKYRERYFCCMAEKCAPNVLPESIDRQTVECEARNMEFTFDIEEACGITVSTSTAVVVVVQTATSTSVAGSKATTVLASTTDSASAAPTTSSATGTTDAPSTGSETTEEPSATPTSGASAGKVMLNGIVVLAAACGIFLS